MLCMRFDQTLTPDLSIFKSSVNISHPDAVDANIKSDVILQSTPVVSVRPLNV